NSDAFARGYIFGVTRASGSDLKKLNLNLDEVEKTNASLSFFIALPGGEQVNSFGRGIKLVREGRIAPALLGNFTVWVGSRKIENGEVRLAVETLLPLVQSGNAAAGDAAVELVAYQTTNCITGEDALARLIDIFQDAKLSL